MNRILNKLRYFLSARITTLGIILIAIAGRAIQLVYFFYLGGDRSYQTITTQNFLHGHGISSGNVIPQNLSEIFYEPLTSWPPGYSLLLSPFYALFNHNYIAAGLTLDILFSIILILVTRGILKILETPAYLINIYTLLTCFTIYSFYKKPYDDTIAITLFLTALYFSLQLIKSPSSWKLKTGWLIISLVLCAFTKYLYMPIVLIIPAFLILKGFVDTQSNLKKAGIMVLLVTVAAITVLLIYHKNISGTATFIRQPIRGFFPEHILSSYPIIPASLITPETTGLILEQNYRPGSVLYQFYQWVHVFTFFFILLYGSREIYRKGLHSLSTAGSFFYITFFTFLSITAILLILSVRIDKESGYWTYLQEPRYYGLITILLQLTIFIAFQYFKANKNRLLKYLFLFSMVLLLPEMFRGILFSANRVVNCKKEEYIWQQDYKFQQYADAIIRKKKQANPVNQVILAGSSPYMNNRIILYSRIPEMKDVGKINNIPALNSKTSVLLLVVLREDVLKHFTSFLSAKDKEDAGYFAGFYFYTLYVTPH